MSSRRSRLRRLAANLLLAAAAATITLLAAEGGLRLAAHHILGAGEWLAVGRVFERHHPILGYSLLPGSARVIATGGAYVQRETINRRGLRDIEREPELRPDDPPRLLVLGDSFVYGQGVSLEDSLPRQLARRLPGVDVINGGVPGYDLGQSYLHYAAGLKRYGARTVLFGFFMNDLVPALEVLPVYDAGGLPIRYERRREFIDREAREAAQGSLSAWLRANSLGYALVRGRLERWRADRRRRNEGGTPRDATRAYRATFAAGDPDRSGAEWERGLRILEALKAAVEAEGARFGLFVIPAAWQTSDEEWRAWSSSAGPEASGLDRTIPQRRLARWCERTSTPCLDLLPLFEGEAAGLIFSGDLHWTPEGTGRVAGALAAFVERNGLAPSERVLRK